ncbi:antibiotic biosynthesis monooxygenase, partial [Accumulibacter sp.]|uniref:antibiotic biosynthesis monooxygenase n=1 Tax=Accumulibacter sp. TaxID=2053492 RepID=UPI0025D2B90C
MNPSPPTDSTAEAVTGIIVHRPRADAREEYERWLIDIRETCRRFPGYLSTDVIRPVANQPNYTVIIRFAGIEALRAWMLSPERRDHLQRIEHALEQADRYEIRTGLDFWFTPPTLKPPKPWKQYLLTLSAIFPLTVIVPWALAPLLGGLPMLATKAMIAAVIVALMVYVIMPRYTRLV